LVHRAAELVLLGRIGAGVDQPIEQRRGDGAGFRMDRPPELARRDLDLVGEDQRQLAMRIEPRRRAELRGVGRDVVGLGVLFEFGKGHIF
jgi:hypothetical protein